MVPPLGGDSGGGRGALPGDDVVPDPALQTTRAVTVDAPVEEVWPWLAQIGQDRGGFYSYQWLENLAGCEMRNAEQIHPDWQHRDIGETVLLHPATGLEVARFEPERSYAFAGGWYFALAPIGERRTRLFARGRIPRGRFRVAYAALLEMPHFIMERKMLLGIKARAERAATSAHSSRRRHSHMTLAAFVDEYLPLYDVSDGVAVVVDADPARTWEALMSADLIALARRRPLVGILGGVRILPELVAHLLHGERPPGSPKHLTLRDTTEIPAGDGGWVLLGERPGRELALGLVGRFWRPVIQYASITPAEFVGFAEPGFAKTVYALSVEERDGKTLLSAVMRTATTDERARTWFRRYWTVGVGSGAHLLVHALLDVVREDLEAERPDES